MGTRNLTIVVYGGEYKIAKYCQWDGYLEGQGKIILNFLTSKFNKENFITGLLKVKTPNNIEIKEIQSNRNWATEYPYLSRDMDGEILEQIQDGKVLFHIPDIAFAKDSLSCEWAYLIDLDNDTFEIYKGFNKSPLGANDRFYFNGEKDNEYYPIRLLKSYPLSKLPTEKDFLALDNEE